MSSCSSKQDSIVIGNKRKINLHEKAVNFTKFLSVVLGDILPKDLEEKESIVSYLEKYFNEESKFLDFQFVYVAGLCNSETTRGTVSKLRDMAYVEGEAVEQKKLVLQRWRKFIHCLAEILANLETKTDEEFETIFTRICQYIHLFTAMYFK